MTKFYHAVRQFNSLLKKSSFVIVVFLSLLSGSIKAQVSLTATLGTATGTFTTLGGAFTAINAGTHRGNIVISINANTNEGATPATINGAGIGASNYGSILIQPTANVTVTANTTTATIKLNGADDITINGLNGANQLTIINSNASLADFSSCIWLACNSASDGSKNNIIRNCIIKGAGTTTTYSAILQSGTVAGNIAETGNESNTYQGNTITGAESGIIAVGPIGNESGTTITGNTIGGTVALDKMSFRSIWVAQQQGVLISGNTILGSFSTVTGAGNENTGISINGTISSGLVEKNKISDIKKQGIWGCSGMFLNSSSATTNMIVANNFIWDVAAGGFNGTNIDDNGYGIALAAGGGYKIQYNTVNMATNQPTNVGITGAFWLSTSATINSLDVRDNIFSNQQTNSTRYAVICRQPASSFSNINFNDYYSLGSVGFLGGAQATLANWQTATTQDASSLAVNPSFFSPTNLHLFFNSTLNNLGTPIPGITQDIDGDTRNATTPDMGADEFTPPNCSGNSGGTATASTTSICASGTSTLSATGFDYGLGITYQWQSGTSATGPWTNIAGQTNPVSATTPTISATTWFRLFVTCSFVGGSGSSTVVQVTVNNPTPTGTTPGTRCGIGSVNLAATGSSLTWYAASSGGTPLGTGPTFATPSISATTNFYVSASASGSTVVGGKPSTNGADLTNPDGGIRFTALSSFILNSVVMYPQATGISTISLYPGTFTTGVPIFQMTYNFTSTGAQTVPIGWTIPAGTYTIFKESSGPACWRDFFSSTPPIAYPYNIGTTVTLTDGSLSGFYYFFYNWNITATCEGVRVPVAANVTPPPAISTTATPSATICIGSSVNLNVTSGNAGYAYVWNPGNLSGAPQTVSPTSSQAYIVTATDASGGPNNGCVNSATVTVNVNPTPTPLVITPVTANVCSGAITMISVTGGLLADKTKFTEFFETFPTAAFTVTGAGLTATSNTTYYSQGTKSVLLKNIGTTNTTSSYDMVTGVNLTPNVAGTARLTFNHICAAEKTYDFGYVEYSDNGGAWTSFPTTSYLGSGVLKNGVVSFDGSSYSDWSGQFTGTTSTPGTGPATSLWKREVIDLSTWQTSTNFKVRFRYTSDISLVWYGWLIDSVRISTTEQAPVTWSPTAELFTNPGATIPYTGQNLTTVYTKPTVPHIYTATASGGTCSATATSTITPASGMVNVTVVASPGGSNACAGIPITFTATPTNGGTTPAYEWYVGATLISGPPTSTNVFTTTLVAGDIVTVKLFSNLSCVTNNPATSTGIVAQPLPTVTISGPTSICNTGGPYTLTATAAVSPGSVSTYEWFLGAVSQGAPSASNTFNATQPGAYTVVATSLAGCPKTSAVYNVTRPTYNITAINNGNGVVSPAGVTAVNCGSNQTYTFTPNASYAVCDVLVDGVSVGTPGSYTFTNVLTTHTIEVTFCIVGCSNPPIANAGSPTASICENQTYTLSGSVTGPGGTTGTWSTSGSGTFTPNATTLNATYTPGPADITAGTVTLTLTTNNPSGAPCVPSTSNITIQIKHRPVVSISGTPGFCPASNTTLTAVASITPAGPPITYAWFLGASPLGTAVSQGPISAVGAYQVTATANGCSNSASVPVIQFVNPTVIIDGPATFCTSVSTVLSATVTLGSGPVATYQWQYSTTSGGTYTDIPFATGATYSTTVAGFYKVKITDIYACAVVTSAFKGLAIDNSPLNGIYTISTAPATCTNFNSFAAAVTALNTRSISGNVEFNAESGFTETVPVLGLQLGTTTLNDATRINGYTIIFRNGGVGANPLLSAYAGGIANSSSAVPDGIFAIKGTDNVTIDGIDVLDGNAPPTSTVTAASGTTTITVASTAGMSAGMPVIVISGTGVFATSTTITSITNGTQFVINTAPSIALAIGDVVISNYTNFMEYGYGLFKLSGTDGVQNSTIQNCRITLNKNNNNPTITPSVEGSAGIIVTNALSNNVTSAVTVTSANGSNSNNRFYSNIISNCNHGIALMGFAASSPYVLPSGFGDTGNDVGGSSGVTGNSIKNFGGGGSSPANGIRVFNQWGANISYNTVNNNDGSGINHAGVLRGIFGQGAAAANVSILSNIISVKSGAIGSTSCSGIENSIGNAGSGNTVSINGNEITGAYSTAVSGSWTGIVNTATANASTVNINSNTIENVTFPGSGAWIGISNQAITASLSQSNNILRNNTITSTGAFTGILTASIGTGALNQSGNVVAKTTKSIVAGVGVAFISSGIADTAAVNGNKIFDNTVIVTGSGTVSTPVNCVVTSTSRYSFSNNLIFNIAVTGSSASLVTLLGLQNQGSPAVEKITNDTIRRLYITGTASLLHVIRGISSTTGASSVKTISGNVIDSLYCDQSLSAAIAGIHTSSGATVNVFKNKVQNIFPGQNGVLAGFGKGISIVSGTTVNVYNNMVNLDLTLAFSPAANAKLAGADALKGIEVAGGTTANLYYNTVRLKGTGINGFGSSTIGITSATPTVTLINNLIVNETTPVGVGIATALRRTTASLTSYGASSNNNAFYIGTASSTRVFYYNGATGYQVMAPAGFQAAVATRESASIGLSTAPAFMSIANPIDLHLDPANNCDLNSAGIDIPTYTIDFDGDTRATPKPDIGADEFNGTGGSPIWKGVDTNWENPDNWCGVVPTVTTDVTIPAGAPFYPIIITTTPVARNITIAATAQVTIDPIGVLSTKGSWTNNGTLTNNGTIVLNGTTNQVFPGTGTGTMPSMTSLTVANPAGATINKALVMYGILRPNQGVITVNDVITLHSDPSTTAMVDTVLGSFVYGASGKFVVERYISSLTRTAWRFLSIPTVTTQTINQAWMEGQTPGNYVSTGFGMQIVGPSSAGTGFDVNNTLSSLKKYTPVGNTWTSVAGTNIPINTTEGYMSFIRGDRGSNTFGAMSATTLRTEGPIKTGPITVSTPSASTFISVGNPYPCPIDILSTSTTKTGLQTAYYVWDPKLGSYGSYQTFSSVNGYVANPGGGSYSGGNKYIESGQAFFVVSTAGAAPHSITLNENSKVVSNVQVARDAVTYKELKTRFYVVSGADANLYDGVSVVFDNANTNAVDDHDAPKFSNFGENISIRNGTKLISVESRADIVDNDTIFLNLGQLRIKQYQLEFIATELSAPGRTAFLEDSFLNSSTPINLEGTSTVNFDVINDAGSYAADRFRIVFKQLGVVPVTFTSISANKEDKNVRVSWKVENELNIDHYDIEESADGRNFSKAGTQYATGNGTSTSQYNWLDVETISGDNFYRIKSVDNSGISNNSAIVKVSFEAAPTSIAVFPNPLKEDGVINIRLTDLPKAAYQVKIMNAAGQVVMTRKINHDGGTSVYSMKLNNGISHGTYNLQVLQFGKIKTTVKILY